MTFFKHPSQEFVYTRTYSRWLEGLGRRETWPETVERYVSFIKEERGEKIPAKVLKKIHEGILNMKVVPSMRALWTAGPAAKRDNTCMYNCSYLDVNNPEAFSEGLFLLMCGAGLGFGVRKSSIEQLPEIPIHITNQHARFYNVEDSREGWANSVKELVRSLYSGNDLDINYNTIRPSGIKLKTFGGTSSGPAPLAKLHEFIRQTFYAAKGRKLTSLECHDIMNELAIAVIAGNVRRSAEISLSDLDDIEMREAKTGMFPNRRWMANNSAIYDTKPSSSQFLKEWASLATSGTGERGISNIGSARNNSPKRRKVNDIKGFNPCHEIALRNKGLCNLSEVVITAEDDLDSLLEKIETATWLGAIQSTFTHFPYLSKQWEDNANEERLLGVSLTGQMDNPKVMTPDNLKALKSRALKIAKKAADILEVNYSVSVTCVKPSGCRPWNALTTTDSGLLTLEELFEDHKIGETWETFQQNIKVNNNKDYNRILKTYDNKLSEVNEISLCFGMTVESTLNHKWFVKGKKNKKQLIPINKWVETKDIEIGHVLEVIPNLYNKSEHSRFLKFNSRTINMRPDSFEINQPEYLNEELAWLLGYLWGDGAMSPSQYRVRFIDEHLNNLEKAQKIIKDNFNLDVNIHKASQHRKAFTLDISSKVLWHWLIKNNIWKYFNEKIDIIPKCVRTSSKSDIIAFIAGLVDSDGWAGKNNEKKGVMITTQDVEFSKHLQHIAWSVGLCFGRSLNSKGNNFQKVREMYLMGISSETNIESGNILRSFSNKMKKADTDYPNIIWMFENKNKKKTEIGLVKSNVGIGQKETFDIEVENTHEYFNGSVRSHNTVSALVDSASGLHPRFDHYYIRRYRISALDPLFNMIKDQGIKLSPENGQSKEDWDTKNPAICHIYDGEEWSEAKVNTWILEFPMAAPKDAIIARNVSAIDQLEYYKMVQTNYCEHNASITVYVKEDEWLKVGSWVYDNWDCVVGVSFLPYSEHSYKQAPYESITKEQYEALMKDFKQIDYSQLSKYEVADNTSGARTFACVGGGCDV